MLEVDPHGIPIKNGLAWGPLMGIYFSVSFITFFIAMSCFIFQHKCKEANKFVKGLFRDPRS